MAKENQKNTCGFKTSIGGQALIEGIMMLGPKKRAIVCRTENGFAEKVEDVRPFKDISPILAWPFIRGVVGFLSSMINGVKALSFSAEQLPEDMQDEPDKIDLWIKEHFSDETAQKLIIGTAVSHSPCPRTVVATNVGLLRPDVGHRLRCVRRSGVSNHRQRAGRLHHGFLP